MDQDIRRKQYEEAHPTDERVRIKRYNHVAINQIIDLQEKGRKDRVKKSERQQEAMLEDMADHFLHNEVNSPKRVKEIVEDIKKANS